MKCFLLATLAVCSLAACGDKDDSLPLDSADSAEPTDTDTGEPAPVCAMPTFTPVAAFVWPVSTPYGGYALTSTDSRVLIADPVAGDVLGIPWGQPSGELSYSYDLLLTGLPYSPDKLTRSGEWIGIADAAREVEAFGAVGAVFGVRAVDLDALSGVHAAADVAEWTLIGHRDGGYTGALLVADLDGDGLDDAATQSGPLPGEIAVFSDVGSLSGEHPWTDAAFTVAVCDSTDRVAYASTSLAIFGEGSGQGMLVAGCPGLGYRGGEAWGFDLPLRGANDPATKISGVSGWYVASEGVGFPAFIDARNDASIVQVRDDGADGLTLEGLSGSGEKWWGSAPVAVSSPAGDCGVLIVGSPGALTKSDETGAVYAVALDGYGEPVGEWAALDFPSAEVTPQWIGSVQTVSPDGRHLASSGWQPGGGEGGGMITWEIGW